MTKRGEVWEWLQSGPFEETDECIEWPYARNGNGYGSAHRSGVTRLATHLVMEIAQVSRPEGAEILHSCDNKPCVNFRHIRWGTRSENLVESFDRGLRQRDPIWVKDPSRGRWAGRQT